MSKKDYTKFSKSQHGGHVKTVNKSIPEESVVKSVTETNNEPEIVEQKPTIFGKVIGCSKLNVRQHPNLHADILGCLVENAKIEIEESKSTNDFYAICTSAGLEGFCLKKFVEICK